MTNSVSLENTRAGGFGLPTGQIVPGNGSIAVEPEVWAANKDHPVVKALVEAGNLIVDGKGKRKAPAAADGGTDVEELRKQYDAQVASLQTELQAEKAKVADLEQKLSGQGNDSDQPKGPLTVKETSSGWYAVVDADGKPVTKNFRKDDLAGFDSMSDEDKAAFVGLHKPD